MPDVTNGVAPAETQPVPDVNADFSGWYTHEETAKKLSCCTRTLERLCREGRHAHFAYAPERRLQWTKGSRGGKPTWKYNPEEVDNLVAISKVPLFAHQYRPVDRPDDPEKRSFIPPAMQMVFDCIEKLQTFRDRHVPAPQKLYLTIAEASDLSGLSEAFLRRCVKNGMGFKDGSEWKIPRRDLEDTETLVKLGGSGE